MERERGRFSYFNYIFSRYVRLTPAVFCSIFLFWLFPIILSGPVANEVFGKLVEGCYANWQYNLLHVNNYFIRFPEPILVSFYLFIYHLIISILSNSVIRPLGQWPQTSISTSSHHSFCLNSLEILKMESFGVLQAFYWALSFQSLQKRTESNLTTNGEISLHSVTWKNLRHGIFMGHTFMCHHSSWESSWDMCCERSQIFI